MRSRREKELARLLLRHEVPFYLPLLEKRVRRAGRWFVSFLPLFPGYVFFRGGAAERRTALTGDRVVAVLEALDQGRLDAELRTLWHLQRSGAALVPHPFLGPGDAVEVVEGAFRGLRGTVLREKGRTRLVVSVSLLRQSVAAELERAALVPARMAAARAGAREERGGRRAGYAAARG